MIPPAADWLNARYRHWSKLGEMKCSMSDIPTEGIKTSTGTGYQIWISHLARKHYWLTNDN